MKIFSIYRRKQRIDKRAIEQIYQFSIHKEARLPKNNILPQEDCLLISQKYPIFAVADGVTLIIKKNRNYPNSSGAGEVARIFCNEAVKYAENLYNKFQIKDVLRIFEKANKKIANYNKNYGRTKKTINFADFDFFHTTAAFALVSETNIF
jgi:hypothetical protein